MGITFSIERVPEIGTMGSTAAFLVPWLGTFSDQSNLFVALFFGDGPPNRDFLVTQKTIPVNLNRINTTDFTKIVRLNTLITHDTSGNGRHWSTVGAIIKFLPAFGTLNHGFSPLSLDSRVLRRQIKTLTRLLQSTGFPPPRE
jgi:hypothetical protein